MGDDGRRDLIGGAAAVRRVMVCAPVPLLTVTVEQGPDVHIHCGGQGVWQARGLGALGIDTVLCGAFGGESGPVVRSLIEDQGTEVHAVTRSGRNGVFVHDRRNGRRTVVAEQSGDALSRHELDNLYSLCLAEGLRTGICVLSGPADQSLLAPDTYRRLTRDLRAMGGKVVVDLSGPLLDACLEAGVDLLKISDEELTGAGGTRPSDPAELLPELLHLRRRGARTVVLSRAGQPALALIGEDVCTISLPEVEVVDPQGAGDSMTAGITAGFARGLELTEAVRLGAAAGALNVTRHGLGTIQEEAVWELAKHVRLTTAED